MWNTSKLTRVLMACFGALLLFLLQDLLSSRRADISVISVALLNFATLLFEYEFCYVLLELFTSTITFSFTFSVCSVCHKTAGGIEGNCCDWKIRQTSLRLSRKYICKLIYLDINLQKMFSATAPPTLSVLDLNFNLYSQFSTLVPLKHTSSWSQLQWPGRLQQVVQEVWCV